MPHTHTVSGTHCVFIPPLNLIRTFNKYLLTTKTMPGTVPGTGDTTLDMVRPPPPRRLLDFTLHQQQALNKQTITEEKES